MVLRSPHPVLCPILALVLLALVPAVRAEALYKCTDPKGAVSIQSEACPKGSTQVWRREATPDPGPTPEELSARVAMAQVDADRAAEAARQAEQARLADQARRTEEALLRAAKAAEAAGSQPPVRKSECTQAHDFSDAAAAKPWLDLNQAQREAIKRWVVETCRDPDSPVRESADL